MATFTIDDVKTKARRASIIQNKASVEALNEAARSQTTSKIYNIFLSHAFSDADLIRGVMTKLQDYGYRNGNGVKPCGNGVKP